MMAAPRKSAPAKKDASGPAGKPCDYPGCAGDGAYRAPRARDRLNEYYWFCLDHVRDYNKAWNYYAGLSPDEIERMNRADDVGQRPTWPLGARTAGARAQARYRWRDPFGFARETDGRVGGDGTGPGGRRNGAAGGNGRGGARPPTPEQEAIRIFEIDYPLTPASLKTRYKELVKRYHPDANGGDKKAEDKLKEINRAYAVLRAAVGAQPSRM